MEDPSFFETIGALVAVWNDYVRSELKYKNDLSYIFLSDKANRSWNWVRGERVCQCSWNLEPGHAWKSVLESFYRQRIFWSRYRLLCLQIYGRSSKDRSIIARADLAGLFWWRPSNVYSSSFPGKAVPRSVRIFQKISSLRNQYPKLMVCFFTGASCFYLWKNMGQFQTFAFEILTSLKLLDLFVRRERKYFRASWLPPLMLAVA